LLPKRRRRAMRCSFCKRQEGELEKLISGPRVTICNFCIGICNKILEVTPSPFAGWDSMSDGQLLQSLKPSQAAAEAMRSVLRQQIETLRRRGVSWSEIGASLGISRQAAWERFS
jgi:hypothetical protein